MLEGSFSLVSGLHSLPVWQYSLLTLEMLIAASKPLSCCCRQTIIKYQTYPNKCQEHHIYKCINRLLKDIEILAIILVPLIMTLSRGHTG